MTEPNYTPADSLLYLHNEGIAEVAADLLAVLLDDPDSINTGDLYTVLDYLVTLENTIAGELKAHGLYGQTTYSTGQKIFIKGTEPVRESDGTLRLRDVIRVAHPGIGIPLNPHLKGLAA